MLKRAPKSSKNEILIFGLCSTSHDQSSNLSDVSRPKCKKGPPKSLTNKMVVGLAGVILLVISRAPTYCIRLMSVIGMILLTILISFLVFLFIFSFGSFFLFFIGCDWCFQVAPGILSVFHSLLCYLLAVFCVIFWQSSVLSSGSLLYYVLAVFCLLCYLLVVFCLLCNLLVVFCVIFWWSSVLSLLLLVVVVLGNCQYIHYRKVFSIAFMFIPICLRL